MAGLPNLSMRFDGKVGRTRQLRRSHFLVKKINAPRPEDLEQHPRSDCNPDNIVRGAEVRHKGGHGNSQRRPCKRNY